VLAAITCEEAIMPAVSQTNLANRNATDEKFRVALADALHEEYEKLSTPASSCRSMIRGW
jgi:hypothetical protein